MSDAKCRRDISKQAIAVSSASKRVPCWVNSTLDQRHPWKLRVFAASICTLHQLVKFPNIKKVLQVWRSNRNSSFEAHYPNRNLQTETHTISTHWLNSTNTFYTFLSSLEILSPAANHPRREDSAPPKMVTINEVRKKSASRTHQNNLKHITDPPMDCTSGPP